jgi:hypothetical protein
MDDNNFDDIVKRKVGEYEDPVFDSSALSGLHQRMDTLDYAPWHSRYRTELMIGSGIVMSTLIIILSLWLFDTNSSEAIEKSNLLILSQQEQIAKLQEEVKSLKKLPPDTIYITQFKEQTVPVNSVVLRQMKELKLTISQIKKDMEIRAFTAQPNSIHGDTSSFASSPAVYFDPDQTNLFYSRIIPEEKRQKSLRASPKPSNDLKQSSIPFSAKMARELEKHYRNGIGIRIGPALELSKGFYSEGAGGIDITGGLLGDFIVSPSFSLETGAKFIHRYYEIPEESLSKNLTLPYVNTDLGALKQADIDSWMIEVPLNLKYRYQLAPKINAIAGLGYSSLIYTKQVLEYSYTLDAVPLGHITEPHNVSDITRYTGALNLSLGISKRLKNNKILETSLFYQQGLGALGVEKMKSNFIGVRGVYWFTIK